MTTQMCPEEGIYNLLPTLKKTFKPPRYVSIFAPAVRREAAQNKAQCKTMGPAKVAVPSPKDFLQRRSKEPKLPERKKEQDGKKLPTLSVPRRTEHPVMGVRSENNFINTNVVSAIKGSPKKPQPICVDTRQGDKYLLETSGLAPKYIKKKGYGVIPKYLIERKEEMKRAQKYLIERKEEMKSTQNEYKEPVKESTLKPLSDEERKSILQGLKKNWDEVYCAFQRLPLQTDTIPRKLYKEKLASQMRQLEHDIEVIEKHKVIYITDE